MEEETKLHVFNASESRRLRYIVQAPTREAARELALANGDLWRVTEIDGDEDDDDDYDWDDLSPNTKPDAVWSVTAVAQAKVEREKRDKALKDAKDFYASPAPQPAPQSAPSSSSETERFPSTSDAAQFYMQCEAWMWRVVKAAATEVHNQAWQRDQKIGDKGGISDDDMLELIVTHIAKLGKDPAAVKVAASRAQ